MFFRNPLKSLEIFLLLNLNHLKDNLLLRLPLRVLNCRFTGHLLNYLRELVYLIFNLQITCHFYSVIEHSIILFCYQIINNLAKLNLVSFLDA
jgi:hypothetical protein